MLNHATNHTQTRRYAIMRNILLIILIILINSCESKDEINGIWVGPYRDNPFQNQATVSEPYIIKLENGDFQAEGLYFNNDSGKYSYSLKNFEFNNEGSMEFASKPNVDSIAFKGTKEDPYPIIFRKVPDSLKSDSFNKIKLSGEKFIFDGINNSDTLHFENDSILSYSSQKNRTYYKRIYFNAFDVIFISNSRTPPLFIKDKVGKKIKITSYPKKLKNIILTEI